VICIGISIIYFTQKIWLDSLLGVIVGIYILFPSYKIIREAIAGIMDESDKELIQKFIQLMKKHKHDTWIDLHNLKILKN
jgi:divalent metal cation (Fe/Co/Zn/Cd) transporter